MRPIPRLSRLGPSCGREVVRASLFGYPERVKRRSPLDTLKELRQRAHDTQRSQLAHQIEAERAAAAQAEQARQVLLETLRNEHGARLEEDRRLGENGITAADGQRRAEWERAMRQTREALTAQLDRAVDEHRAALDREEQARRAVDRSDAELKQVQERLNRAELNRRRELERAQQETLDESSMRRFLERNGA
jgi:hypothetical protein